MQCRCKPAKHSFAKGGSRLRRDDKRGECRDGASHVRVRDITIGNDLPLVFIIGPNTLESRAHAAETSAALAEIAPS